MKSLATQLKEARGGMTQAEFGATLGSVAQNTLGYWEKGTTFPHKRLWRRLAKVLKITYQDIEELHRNFEPLDPRDITANLLLGEEQLQYLIRVVKVLGHPLSFKEAAVHVRQEFLKGVK